MPRVFFLCVVLSILPLAGCAEPSGSGLYQDDLATLGQQQRAVELIQQQGGGVTWEGPGATVILSLRNSESIEQLYGAVQRIRDVHTLTLINRGLSADELKLPTLGNLPRVEYLMLEDVPLTSETLAWIAGLPQLRGLDLIGTGVTDEQMQTIAAMPRLQRLTLALEPVTDAGVLALQDAPVLDRIRLSQTQITPEAAQQLIEVRPTLIVDLNNRRFRGVEAPE